MACHWVIWAIYSAMNNASGATRNAQFSSVTVCRRCSCRAILCWGWRGTWRCPGWIFFHPLKRGFVRYAAGMASLGGRASA